MTLWKVRVECFRKGVMHPVIRRFIVDANDAPDALAKALEVARNPEWIEFKARDPVTVTVPLEI